LFDKAAEARLLVSSVSQGSIDIRFLIDLAGAAQLPALLPGMIDKAELLLKFAEKIKHLLDYFLGETPSAAKAVTVKDCDDAINVIGPIAEAGGVQNISIHKGDVNFTVLQVNAQEARKIVEAAANERALLAAPSSENRQRVSLVWAQLARDAAKVDGKRSPDKGLIADIDAKAHAVLFTDEMAFLKRELIDNDDNPMQKVYFVDVEVSRLPDGRVSAYRIVGYHGKDDI
jgi:hypothetical protein